MGESWISKILHGTGVLIIPLFLYKSAFVNSIHREPIFFKILDKIFDISTCGFYLLIVFAFFFPPKSKFKFKVDFNGFHPIYNNEENEMGSGAFKIFFVSIGFIIVSITDGASLSDLFDIIPFAFLILLSSLYFYRRRKMNIFPTALLLNKPHNLIIPYYDFIKGNIKDDNPNIEIGQSFKVDVKKIFRNRKERDTIVVLNDKIIDKPAIIAKWIDKPLANKIRNENIELKMSLVAIHDFANLEVSVCVENNYFKTSQNSISESGSKSYNQ